MCVFVALLYYINSPHAHANLLSVLIYPTLTYSTTYYKLACIATDTHIKIYTFFPCICINLMAKGGVQFT